MCASLRVGFSVRCRVSLRGGLRIRHAHNGAVYLFSVGNLHFALVAVDFVSHVTAHNEVCRLYLCASLGSTRVVFA